MTITAIPTPYNGILFRSKLEGSHAALFDLLGVDWRYETQGFNLTHDWTGKPGTFNYLPDFYLPGLNWWVEVKPAWSPSEPFWRYLDAAQALINGGADGFLFSGDLSDDYFGDVISPLVLRAGAGGRYLRASPWFSSDVFGEGGARDLVPGFVDSETIGWLLKGQKVKACDAKIRNALDRVRMKRLGWA